LNSWKYVKLEIGILRVVSIMYTGSVGIPTPHFDEAISRTLRFDVGISRVLHFDELSRFEGRSVFEAPWARTTTSSLKAACPYVNPLSIMAFCDAYNARGSARAFNFCRAATPLISGRKILL
jgi:hypothetical protein